MDYSVVASKHIKTLVIEKSQFIAVAMPFYQLEELPNLMKKIKQDFPKATHYCYGYVIDSLQSRGYDDGEPRGTAGRPILTTLQTKGFAHTLIVVVRYFGGTLLGAPGLTRAYRQASELVLQSAPIVYEGQREHFRLEVSLDNVYVIEHWIKLHSIVVIERSIEEMAHYQIYLDDPTLLEPLRDSTNGKVTVHPLGMRPVTYVNRKSIV